MDSPVDPSRVYRTVKATPITRGPGPKSRKSQKNQGGKSGRTLFLDKSAWVLARVPILPTNIHVRVCDYISPPDCAGKKGVKSGL
jgi:hypothetical protein